MQLIPHDSDDPVRGPGSYRMTAARYHADPAPQPSMSSGIANCIIDDTPAHARVKHPRLSLLPTDDDATPELQEKYGIAEAVAAEPEEAQPERVNVGSVAHEILLGQGGGYDVISGFKDWRTKAAKERRDEAIEAGLTPILEHQYDRAEKVAASVRRRVQQIDGLELAFVSPPGAGEIANVWFDEQFGCWCRSLLDWWGPEANTLIDLKTTTVGLSDDALDRRIAADGIDTQIALQARGVTTFYPQLAGGPKRLRYYVIFVEQGPPFEVRALLLNSEQRERGWRRMVHAGVLFGHCLRTGKWPGYPRRVTETPVPEDFTGWPLKRWLEREKFDPKFGPIAEPLLLALSGNAPLPGRGAMDQEIPL
ncbi:MAG: hypothetical protein ACJ8AD_14780 [Gemmatimonadaceae bacterium]